MLETQTKLALSPYIELYDKIIPEDNLLKRINKLLNFSFVFDELKNKYSINDGRKAIDPIMMFKYLLLKILYPCSDRDLINRARYDMSFKYFLGLMPEDDVIAPSSLTKFRTLRLKDSKLLDLLLGKTVSLAIEKGVIEMGTVIIDATHTHSKYNTYSSIDSLRKRAIDLVKELSTKKIEVDIEALKSQKELVNMMSECRELVSKVRSEQPVLSKYPGINEKINFLEEGIEDAETRHEVSKDMDAKKGYKSANSPFIGYKTHLGIAPNRIILGAVVTTGEAGDGPQLPAIVEQARSNGYAVNAVVGDGAYGSENNINLSKEKGSEFKLVAAVNGSVMRERKDGFYINKDADTLVCPMGYLAESKKEIKTKKSHYFTYKFDITICDKCECKDSCAAYKNRKRNSSGLEIRIPKQVHLQQIEFSKTDEYKEYMKERYKVEAKNGELKNYMGYDKADSYGLKNMEMQSALTLFACNIKRILTLMEDNK